jgi:hypothetical protein
LDPPGSCRFQDLANHNSGFGPRRQKIKKTPLGPPVFSGLI